MKDSSNTTNQALRYGREGKPDTTETDGKMMQRVTKSLMSLKRIMAFNDEGHHCYREKPQDLKDTKLDADEKVEADRNNAAARLWINGLEAVGRQKNLTASDRPLRHTILPPRFRIPGRDPVSMDCLRLLPNGRHRVRDSEDTQGASFG